MTHDENGRIKLTWHQVVTILGFILAVGAAWYDMRAQIAGVKNDISAMRVELAFRVQQDEARHVWYESRLDHLDRRR